jgi:cytochrome c oxidase assembly protein subunit 15
MRAYARFAWTVLSWNVAVVAWGAFVRATGSGAGCGKHWPLCNGVVVPRDPGANTLIEFAHRCSSGAALLLVAALLVWALRAFPRGHAARAPAIASMVLIVTEALVGAGLVLFGWVAKDTSPERGWVMAVHLTNTFLLLGALALAAWRAGHPVPLALRGRGALAVLLGAGLAAALLAGVTGAIAALGDTLFPSTSFLDGLRHELSGEAALLLRLRVLHPFASVLAGFLLLACARAATRAPAGAAARNAASAVAALVAVQIAAGVANVLLVAPVWLQLVHLVLADLLWVAAVLMAAASLAPGEERARAGAPVPAPA